MTSPNRQFDYDARTERLLRRTQQPGGMIDLRLPQEMVARMAGWFGRLSMLDRCNARYNSPASEVVWATKQRPSEVATGSALMPVSGHSMSVEAEAKPDSESHQFRVRRQTASSQPSELSSRTPQKDSFVRNLSLDGIESAGQPPAGDTIQRKTDTSKEFDAPDAMSSSVSWLTAQGLLKTQIGRLPPTAASFTPAGPSSDELTLHRYEELPGHVAGPVGQETGHHSQTIQKPVVIQRKQMGLDHQFDYDARTERLLHRLQQPGGVIDLRRPQEMVARMAGWVGRRFPMLDRWNARYNSPAFEAVWAIAEQRPSDVSTGSSLMPVPSDSMLMEAETKPDSEPHQSRVRRQMAPLNPSLLSPETEQKDTTRSSLSPGGIESPSQATTGKTVQRKKGTVRAQDTRTSTAVLAFSPTRTSGIYPTREQWSAARPLQLSSTAASGEFAGADAEGAMIGDNLQPNLSPASLLSNASETYPSSGIKGPAADIIGEANAGNNSHAALSPASPFPTEQKTATVQCKAIPDSRVREMPRQGLTPAAGPMIWRRAGTAQMSVPAGRPLFFGGPAAIQRFADSPGSARSSSSISNSDAPAATSRTESGINIAQMVEDVGRLLTRQLIIERERRGRVL